MHGRGSITSAIVTRPCHAPSPFEPPTRTAQPQGPISSTSVWSFTVSIVTFELGPEAAGLNLTGADTVIIHDCDFNPQIDRQAGVH
jgi:hypothetical protein